MDKLAKKFQIKPGQNGCILNMPVSTAHLFQEWPKELIVSSGAELDFVLAFVLNIRAVQENSEATISLVKPDGLLWFAYPKKSSGLKTDISRDKGWISLDSAGYRPVRQIALDETWSALRFRLKELAIDSGKVR